MIVGVPKEIKDNEYRVALTPGGAEMLVQAGHKVLVQKGAGEGSGFTDKEFARSGATVVATAADTWTQADMIMKVKEPLASEYGYLRPNLILFTYLHLAAVEDLTHELIRKKVVAIGYETVQLPDKSLPLLVPMSEVAGRMAVQVGAHCLEKMNGGRGKLLGGVPGVAPCDVLIIGGGVVGINAAEMALGMGAHVVIIDKSADRLRYLSEILHGSLTTIMSNSRNIAEAVTYTDLLIGAVLVPGAKAPKLVTKEMVASMKTGAVIVDVAVDQGGCVETVHATTHSNPTYEVNGVVHYCVANMPGAVPRTSTYALTNVTIPYALNLANLGAEAAIKVDAALAKGVNVYNGHVTYRGVAEAFGLPYKELGELL
jgi:alanine dehydrogenase